MIQQVKNEWGHEKPGIIAMDIITMVSVALQMAVNLTQIALIGFGIESAIIPGVGLAVAIVGIVMTILEYVL